MEEIQYLKGKIDKLKLKNEKLKKKIQIITAEDTELIIKLDKKIFDLKEENRFLKAELLYTKTQLEDKDFCLEFKNHDQN